MATAQNPTASKGLLQAFHGQAAGLGLDPDALFAACQMPDDWRDDPDGKFEEHRLFRLVGRFAAETDNPAAAWLCAEGMEPRALGSLGRALTQSLSLDELLRRMGKEVPEHSSHAAFWAARTTDGLWFCRDGMRELSLFDEGRVEAEHWTVQMMIALVRLAAGAAWTPKRVTLQGPDPGWAVQERWLPGAEVAYRRPWSSVLLPEQHLHHPLVAQNGKCAVVDALRTALRDELLGGPRPAGAPGIAWASEVSGLSMRSLQRLLESEGLDFRRLLAQTRFELATDLMGEPARPLIDIAERLGYSHPAHFTRAFRQWSGVTPSALRRESLES